MPKGKRGARERDAGKPRSSLCVVAQKLIASLQKARQEGRKRPLGPWA